MNPLLVLGETIVGDVGTLVRILHGRGVAAIVRPLPESEELAGGPGRFPSYRRRDSAPPLRTPVGDPAVPRGMPVAGRVSSAFGMREHPVTGKWKPHNGIDIAAPVGTPVLSMAAGVVAYAGGHSNGYGPKMVTVDHGNGYVTRYAHLSAVAVIRGERIARGRVLGESGSAGTGPHLHLEILHHGTARNPRPFLG